MLDIIKKTIDNRDYLLFKDDKISNSIIYSNNFSIGKDIFLNCPFVKESIKENNVIFDIGAYIGTTSSIWLSEGCEVFSFEPNPVSYFLLQNNLKYWDNKIIFNELVGNGDKYLGMNMSMSTNIGSNYYFKNKFGKQSIKLDSFCYLDKVDLIKIDAEGMELKILKNSLKFLNKFKPVIIIELFERALKRNKCSVDIINNFLIQNNYKNVSVLKYNDFVFCHSSVL